MLCCEAWAFPVGMATRQVGHFLLRRKRACIWTWTTWLAAILFLGDKFFAMFASSPLAVSMPPTKVCLQCKAAVPVKRKTCERCDLVFRSKRKQSVICERKLRNTQVQSCTAAPRVWHLLPFIVLAISAVYITAQHQSGAAQTTTYHSHRIWIAIMYSPIEVLGVVLSFIGRWSIVLSLHYRYSEQPSNSKHKAFLCII